MDLPEADTAPATAEPVVCTEPEPQPESDEPVAETPASINPESLLATARDAFARGDIAGAKALALQVALVMAQCETTRTQQQVQTTEERLRSNACAVERARFDVRDAETLVEDTTKRVTDGENDLQEKKAGADDIQLDCECIEESITKLDEEIRALMMRRDEELAHLAETRARLETARMTQEEVAAELEQRQQAEQSARVKLENARQAVKTLTFKSTEIETALARSRDELDRRYSSVQDIEKTLEQTAPNAEAALGEGNANDDNSDTAADSASLF
jgi:chromosome segregation ATPase